MTWTRKWVSSHEIVALLFLGWNVIGSSPHCDMVLADTLSGNFF
jgi:hypothetical protein